MAGRDSAASLPPPGPSSSCTAGAVRRPATTWPAMASASSFHGCPTWPLMCVERTGRRLRCASTIAAVHA
eukprot:11127110-Alexandrium_andersonii.AAC.1